MNKVIAIEQIEKLERYLDERLDVIKHEKGNDYDIIYFNGIIRAITLLGFEIVINGSHHTII